MIRISPTAVKDYLNCKFSLRSRIFSPDRAVASDEMKAGSVAHFIIEKYWQYYDEGMAAIEMVAQQQEVGRMIPAIRKNVDNFYSKFRPLLKTDDLIEKMYSYKNPDFPGVDFVGKWDRVSEDVIYDWKTSPRIPEAIDDDPQFMLYHDLYNKIYGRNPRVFYASLSRGKLLEYIPSPIRIKHLYEEIIPRMVDDIKSGNFPRDGLFKRYSCQYCRFRDFCYSGIGLE